MDPKVVAAADEAKRIEQIENEISQVLNWPLENRLMLLRHMRLQDDLEHVSTALRDLEVSIAVERKKRANAQTLGSGHDLLRSLRVVVP